MSDVYIPGIKSRFETEKLVENLMTVERIPKERVEKNIETLQNQKTYWQDLGRRMNTLRDSARLLFSYQNPFNDRIVVSMDDAVIGGTATREASEQEITFTVKQIAQADRFLSRPLEESYKVPSGVYTFQVGKDEISFNFRGGSLREFTEVLTRRGREKVQASVIRVQQGTSSLLFESLITGAENRLIPMGAAEQLALDIGMMERVNDTRRDFTPAPEALTASGPEVSVTEDETLQVKAGGTAKITLSEGIQSNPALTLVFESATHVIRPEDIPPPQPPPGPDIPSSGSITYGGITVENDDSSVTIPPWTPPPPPARTDNMEALSLHFSDGSKVFLPLLEDSAEFQETRYNLADFAGDKTLVSLEVSNRNSHRDIMIKNFRVFDPGALGGLKPLNPVTVAQNGIIAMDGIEIERNTNAIDDLIPGVTLHVRNPSDKPVKVNIEPDRPAVKEAILALVGNYNRLMAELNILTRRDGQVIQEISYLTDEERESFQARLGAFATDSTLNQYRNGLHRAAVSPYFTGEGQDITFLTQIGIGTDMRRAGSSGGIDFSRLRGYLEIYEKVLDSAMDTKLPAIKQLFGFDTDGDLAVDSGIAHSMDAITRPYMETGGIISMKTRTIDSRLEQDGRRIETLDRQLAAKEASLKTQYAQMEGAYNRMDQLSTSLEQFTQRSNNINNNR